uniref:Uncharacterized protein n=1 Tax=Anopheles merus TaxID=30066 RepID=A0A182VIY3_ANOME
MRIKSWHMAVRTHRELIPRSVIALHSPQPDPAMLEQMSKNITRQGITNSTLNYLRMLNVQQIRDENVKVLVPVLELGTLGPKFQARSDHQAQIFLWRLRLENTQYDASNNLEHDGHNAFSGGSGGGGGHNDGGPMSGGPTSWQVDRGGGGGTVNNAGSGGPEGGKKSPSVSQ